MAGRPSIFRLNSNPAGSPSIFRRESPGTPSTGPTTYPDIDSVPAIDSLADVDTLTEQ